MAKEKPKTPPPTKPPAPTQKVVKGANPDAFSNKPTPPSEPRPPKQ